MKMLRLIQSLPVSSPSPYQYVVVPFHPNVTSPSLMALSVMTKELAVPDNDTLEIFFHTIVMGYKVKRRRRRGENG